MVHLKQMCIEEYSFEIEMKFDQSNYNEMGENIKWIEMKRRWEKYCMPLIEIIVQNGTVLVYIL